MFRPLDKETISRIAEMEIEATVEELAARGRTLGTARGRGDDRRRRLRPEYGARHLQRNIERILLLGLSGLDPGAYTARLEEKTCAGWLTSPPDAGNRSPTHFPGDASGATR